MVRFSALILAWALIAPPVMAQQPVGMENVVPVSRERALPRARWEYRPNGALWTRVALSAMDGHGAELVQTVPKDITDWCPAYGDNPPEARAAFWVGLLSTVSRYESNWKPRAVGGDGRWFGLMQIAPSTAEYRDCRVESGSALLNPLDNLNCAIRIMAVTVPRDQAISVKDTRWRGVAADWGPVRNDRIRRDMQAYTKRQTYCRPLAEVRPKQRPGLLPNF
ncbi:lytic transglycosylase domain-containing protein [Rhodobacteraceae bacterium]|nr:lytic transglycosylase domain-containing protein [Paracoccaceae bacterium]